jgi:hypothetical protein
VTELVFRTLPEPDATMFHLMWPHGDAAAAIEAWQAWAPDAPDEMNANLQLPAAAPTTGCRRAPRRSPTATSATSSSTCRRQETAPGRTAPGPRRTRTARDASTRTSPSRVSTSMRRPTTAATSTASGGQAGLRSGRRVQPSLMRCLTFARRSPLPQVSTSS